MIDSILVATDGSTDAKSAAAEAIDLTERLDVPLHIVSTVETRTAYDNAIVDPAEVNAQLHDRAETAVEATEAMAEDVTVPTQSRVLSGVPHLEILDYATEHDIGAIVLGSTGRSRFKRTLLGSTTEGVLQHADRPVIVCSASNE
ncbi:MAG: universal stress protein [Natrialbaceae archaeon]|nr:universal stress protein [Natrialbaceae archaeon]